MKLEKPLFFRISFLLLLIISVSFLIRDSSHTSSGRHFDIKMPTIEKYNLLKKWLIDDADFTAIADISRMRTKSQFIKYLEDNLPPNADNEILTLKSIFNSAVPISMVSINLNLEGENNMPFFSIIVQGDFERIDLLKSIEDNISKMNGALVSEKVNSTTIYREKNSNSPFAFALPDRNHIVAGTLTSLKRIFEIQNSEPNFPFNNIDSAFFGILRVSPKIKKILPSHFDSIEYALFTTDEQDILHTTIQCQEPKQASDLKFFLSGMKAIYMIQANQNLKLQTALESLIIENIGNLVKVSIPLIQIPEILSR